MHTFEWLPSGAELPRRQLAEGEMLLVQGAASDTMHCVESGALRVELDTARGPFSLGLKLPGDWVGELGMLQPGPVSATVHAAEPTTIRSIDHETYSRWRDEGAPHVGQLLSRIGCDVARRINGFSELGRELRSDGQRLVPLLKTLHGTEREEVVCNWVPASARGHQEHMSDEEMLAALDAAGAFRPPARADAAFGAALRDDVIGIVPSLSAQQHDEGEVILTAGAKTDGLYIILKGQVHVAAGRHDAWHHTDRVLGPGETFGLASFFDTGVQATTCTARGPVSLAVMYPAAVQAMLRQAEQDSPTGLHLLDWFVRQLVRDARALNTDIVAHIQTEV